MRVSRLLACAVLSWLSWLAPQPVFAEPPSSDVAIDDPTGRHSASADQIQVDFSSGTTHSVAFGSADDALADTALDFDADHDADVLVATGPAREAPSVERSGVVAGTRDSLRSSSAPRGPPSAHR
jgi:hypothetical protein